MDSDDAAMNANTAGPLITLTTDFGLTDTYVGVMKGVMLTIAPTARLVDLTHGITPQNIVEASARLEAAIDYFPAGTVHLVVVDPGVGSARAALAVQTDRSLFVAPDNGVLTLALGRQSVRQAVRLDQRASAYFRRPVSATFHGRDIFAPVAAHLASGLSLTGLGAPCTPDSLVTLAMPSPKIERTAAGPILHAPVLYTDQFGNLITAVTPSDWHRWQQQAGIPDSVAFAAAVEVEAGNSRWHGLAPTFAGVAAGAPLIYWGSAGRLEVAIRNGNAARILGLSSQATVILRCPAPAPHSRLDNS